MVALGILVAGYAWATFYPGAPYEFLVLGVTGIFSGYGYKRLQQKKGVYQNEMD